MRRLNTSPPTEKSNVAIFDASWVVELEDFSIDFADKTLTAELTVPLPYNDMEYIASSFMETIHLATADKLYELSGCYTFRKEVDIAPDEKLSRELDIEATELTINERI